MRDEEKLVLLLGRLIDLLQRQPNAVEDQKATLRGLVELCGRGSLSIRVEGTDVVVEGKVVTGDTPFASQLVTQMAEHGLAELRIAHSAPAIDLLQFMRAVAHPTAAYPPDSDVEQRLRGSGVVSINVVSARADAASQERRRVRITEAIQGLSGTAEGGTAAPAEAPVSAASAPAGRAPDIGLVTAASGRAYDDMVRRMLSATSTLSDAISQLAHEAQGPALLRQLDTIQGSITKALDRNRVDQAIDGVVALIRRESQVTSDEGKRQYGVALRRLLSEQSLRRYVPYLLDELYASDVIALIRRAGKDGTKVLIDMVVRAETFAERKTYMSVLRQVEEGTEVIAGMLAHREWFVVRNMADLAGELRIEEAVLPLGRAVEHEDARVRRSVGIALAKIGTPATVPFLAKILQDADPSVRSAVFKEVGGRGHSALAMPLVNALDAEPDAGVRGEYYRALGRIGTQDAIEALRKVAEGGGRLFGRRPASDRIAAVEGLALANTTTSQSVLRSLKDDRTKEIREIARKADQPPAP